MQIEDFLKLGIDELLGERSKEYQSISKKHSAVPEAIEHTERTLKLCGQRCQECQAHLDILTDSIRRINELKELPLPSVASMSGHLSTWQQSTDAQLNLWCDAATRRLDHLLDEYIREFETERDTKEQLTKTLNDSACRYEALREEEANIGGRLEAIRGETEQELRENAQSYITHLFKTITEKIGGLNERLDTWKQRPSTLARSGRAVALTGEPETKLTLLRTKTKQSCEQLEELREISAQQKDIEREFSSKLQPVCVALTVAGMDEYVESVSTRDLSNRIHSLRSSIVSASSDTIEQYRDSLPELVRLLSSFMMGEMRPLSQATADKRAGDENEDIFREQAMRRAAAYWKELMALRDTLQHLCESGLCEPSMEQDFSDKLRPLKVKLRDSAPAILLGLMALCEQAAKRCDLVHINRSSDPNVMIDMLVQRVKQIAELRDLINVYDEQLKWAGMLAELKNPSLAVKWQEMLQAYWVIHEAIAHRFIISSQVYETTVIRTMRQMQKQLPDDADWQVKTQEILDVANIVLEVLCDGERACKNGSRSRTVNFNLLDPLIETIQGVLQQLHAEAEEAENNKGVFGRVGAVLSNLRPKMEVQTLEGRLENLLNNLKGRSASEDIRQRWQELQDKGIPPYFFNPSRDLDLPPHERFFYLGEGLLSVDNVDPAQILSAIGQALNPYQRPAVKRQRSALVLSLGSVRDRPKDEISPSGAVTTRERGSSRTALFSDRERRQSDTASVGGVRDLHALVSPRDQGSSDSQRSSGSGRFFNRVSDFIKKQSPRQDGSRSGTPAP